MANADTSKIPFDKLTDEQARVELARLKKVITEHDWQYHTKSSPTISDADYDDLRDRNETIEMRFPHLVQKSTCTHVRDIPDMCFFFCEVRLYFKYI